MRGEYLDLARFRAGRKSRPSVELSFDDLAVVFKRLVGFGAQAGGKLRRQRQRDGKGQDWKDREPERGEEF
jgi:hypothetical protein